MPNIFFPSRNKPISEPSPEIQLLLSCARTEIGVRDVERIRTQANNAINWVMLRVMARHHRVLPLVYESLMAACPEAVPPNVISQLRNDYRTLTVRNVYLTTELMRILSICDSHGILMIPYKGPILAEISYGDIGLRTFDDLDVLIDLNNLFQVRKILLSNGYVQELPLNKREESRNLIDDCEMHFNKNGAIHFEVHWKLSPRSFGDFYNFGELNFQNYRSAFNDQKIKVLQPKDRLLALCIHGAMHYWVRLNWISDIAETSKLLDEDEWEDILAIAHNKKCERFLSLGLNLASILLQAKLPERIRVWSESDKTSLSQAMEVIDRFYRFSERGLTAFERYSFWVKMHKGFSAKAKAGYNLIAVSNALDWNIIRLPRVFSFIYFIIRPLRLWNTYSDRKNRKFN